MVEKSKSISFWLFSCAAAVFTISLIGAITRLTESGLAIVEWNPVMGAIPPLNDEDWAHVFGLYQTTPQYKLINLGMSLDDFKQIYFWEWLHRLFGRLIGLIYFLPLVIFWIRNKIPNEAKKPLLGILALGFLQGAMGWYMVKSGLISLPVVSHYRLAAHLGLASVIFCSLFYMGLSFCLPRKPAAENLSYLRRLIIGIFALTGITMLWGVFVAGLRAGAIYNNNFPFMGKYLWPTEMFHYSPFWINFFENHAAVQFTHRVLAILTFGAIVLLVKKGLATEKFSRIFSALLIVACLQVGLGITTLITHVNIVVAVLHQVGAMTLLALFTTLLYNAPKKD